MTAPTPPREALVVLLADAGVEDPDTAVNAYRDAVLTWAANRLEAAAGDYYRGDVMQDAADLIRPTTKESHR